MSEKSKIEWTDATWNPVRGCVKVSPGCAHCYAETFAERFRGVKWQQNVPFFFKQWGGFNKKKNGRLLEGRTYDEMPVLKTGPVPSFPSLADRKAIQVEIEGMGMGF